MKTGLHRLLDRHRTRTTAPYRGGRRGAIGRDQRDSQPPPLGRWAAQIENRARRERSRLIAAFQQTQLLGAALPAVSGRRDRFPMCFRYSFCDLAGARRDRIPVLLVWTRTHDAVAILFPLHVGFSEDSRASLVNVRLR